jgi:hypothetical protein
MQLLPNRFTLLAFATAPASFCLAIADEDASGCVRAMDLCSKGYRSFCALAGLRVAASFCGVIW